MFSGDDGVRAGAPEEGLRGELLTVVDRCLAAAAERPEIADQLERHRRRLLEPLRVAVSGAVSAGKSTLVNALVGRRIAPTGAAETTRMVTWYRGGEVERAEVRLLDGSSRQVFLTEDGRVPDDLGVPSRDVAGVHVWVPTSGLLDRITVVDTPGLFSLRDENSRRTREALSIEAGREPEVDTVLFLLGGQQNEADTLTAFVEATTDLDAYGGSVIGVLGRADLANDEEPPLEFGYKKARRLLAEPALRRSVTRILPVIGLLAESVVTSSLRHRDLEALERLAREPLLETMLLSAESLIHMSETGRRAERERLLSLLGLYGTGEGARIVTSGCQDVVQLGTALLEASGFVPLREAFWHSFVARGDAVVVERVVVALTRLTHQLPPVAGADCRDRLEELMLRPSAHGVRELAALRSVAATGVSLTPWLRELLERVTMSDPGPQQLGLPADAPEQEVVRAATTQAARLQQLSNHPLATSDDVAVADVLRGSMARLVRLARPAGASPPGADTRARPAPDRGEAVAPGLPGRGGAW